MQGRWMLSERDTLPAVGTRGAAAVDDAVAKHMTAPIVTADEDERPHVDMEKTTVRRCDYLPVVVDTIRVDIVSIGDVVRLEQIEHEYQAMREYIATA